MEAAILSYYRRLLRENFPNSGVLEHPSVFVETVGDEMINCGNGNFMELYLRIEGYRISDMTYLCSCEPGMNVAVEVLCSLVKGKTMNEALGLGEDAFFQILGVRDNEFAGKVSGLLKLLALGIGRYKSP